jgi:hypothetical protein
MLAELRDAPRPERREVRRENFVIPARELLRRAHRKLVDGVDECSANMPVRVDVERQFGLPRASIGAFAMDSGEP